jgi:hypothetical protein
MKTLFTIATLCIALSSLHAQQTYGIMDLGYSSTSNNLKPVFAFSAGHRFCDSTYWLAPIVEAGVRAHMDDNSNHNIYGFISGGLQFKEYVAFTAGGIYGGNQQMRDRHVYQDTTIELTPGAFTPTYFSYQLALRGMLPILKKKDMMIVITGQLTYAHAVLYESVGVKFSLND